MPDEAPRSRAARGVAEQALIRVVHHYGGRPEFVLLGGFVPDLLCSTSDVRHAGTTDVDVQVDLEIALGSTSAHRLERALLNAEFTPDNQRAWRWVAEGPTPRAVVKFELLTDQDDIPTEATLTFDGCDDLGAFNLRGTGYSSRDVEIQKLHARVGGVDHTAEMNVTGLAGFLLAKAAARALPAQAQGLEASSPMWCSTTTRAGQRRRQQRSTGSAPRSTPSGRAWTIRSVLVTADPAHLPVRRLPQQNWRGSR